MDMFERTLPLVGEEGIKKLRGAHVAVFGLGGVGSYAAEALARAGVGCLTVVDDDVISPSNLNRQLYALHSTLGMAKCDVAKSRILDINPLAKVNALKMRFSSGAAMDFSFDFVIDAIDDIPAKVLLAKTCAERNIPIISCMGTGNKLDACAFKVADVFSTSVCPLAKAMRKLLKDAGVTSLKVVYSAEPPQKTGSRTPASLPFVPPVAGMILAGEAIKHLCGKE